MNTAQIKPRHAYREHGILTLLNHVVSPELNKEMHDKNVLNYLRPYTCLIQKPELIYVADIVDTNNLYVAIKQDKTTPTVCFRIDFDFYGTPAIAKVVVSDRCCSTAIRKLGLNTWDYTLKGVDHTLGNHVEILEYVKINREEDPAYIAKEAARQKERGERLMREKQREDREIAERRHLLDLSFEKMYPGYARYVEDKARFDVMVLNHQLLGDIQRYHKEQAEKIQSLLESGRVWIPRVEREHPDLIPNRGPAYDHTGYASCYGGTFDIEDIVDSIAEAGLEHFGFSNRQELHISLSISIGENE